MQVQLGNIVWEEIYTNATQMLDEAAVFEYNKLC